MISNKFLRKASLFGTVPLFAMFYLLSGTIAVYPAQAQDSDIGWHGDLDRAAEIAAKTNKPIFLVFRCVR